MQNMHGIGPTLVCAKCGFSTTSYQKLRYHERSVHNEANLKPCMLCDKKFTERAKLEIHIDRMHPDSDTPNFSCEYCSKTFVYERSFKNHKFECKNQGYLKKHQERGKLGIQKKYISHHRNEQSKFKLASGT